MKRVLLTLIPWMVTIAAASQGSKPVTVNYTYRGSSGAGAQKIGPDCYVPISMAESWGWKVQARDGNADVFAEGRTIRVPIRRGSTALIALDEAVDQLGGKLVWKSESEVDVRGQVRSVEFVDGKVELSSTLGFSCSSKSLEDPSRIVIDFSGAELNLASLPVFPEGVKLAQYRDGIVRLVIPSSLQFSVAKTPSRTFRLDLTPLLQTSVNPKIAIVPLGPDDQTVNPPLAEGGIVEARPQSTDTMVRSDCLAEARIVNESDGEVSLNFMLTPRPFQTPTVEYESPVSLVVTVPGTKRIQIADAKLQSAFVTSISSIESDDAGKIRIQLSQPLGFVASSTADAISLRLVRPTVSDGRLAGKTIVIDAGHGGTDTGANAGGVFEKDLTLRIAKKLSQALSSEGAAVIMTRIDDVKVALRERSAIATRANADLFVSIHINSNKLSNSRSGAISFFHEAEPISMALAESIQAELAVIGGIPGIGIWSDTRIYKSGFSVLRNATMPAVLLELGFINHGSDRAKLIQEDHQRKIAEAVLKGIKVFLGYGKE